MKKLNVALIGYGRSGWGIHGAFLRSESNDICNVVACVEFDPARREAMKNDFGCDVYSDYTQLFGRTDIDFVISATYSDHHYAVAKDLMAHGFNVLSEKPLCKTADMVQDLIDTRDANNVQFTIFHQYRFNNYWKEMTKLLDQGIIGEPKLFRVKQSYFSHRYDWQTLLYRDAGSLRNNAAHYIEQCMTLGGSDEIPQIYSREEIWNSTGDAEDFAFVVMKYSNGRTFEVEVNPGDAFGSEKPVYEIYGTQGTMQVFSSKIRVKYFTYAEGINDALDHYSLHDKNGNPMYCNNKIVWHEETIEVKGEVWNSFTGLTSEFYHTLYETLVNGAPMFMTAEHVKAQIQIFNEIEKQNPLEVKFERPDDIVKY